MLEIEIDAFSGRPNPRLMATPDEERAILALWDRASAHRAASATPPDLGFRGFVLHRDKGSRPRRVCPCTSPADGTPHSEEHKELFRLLCAIATRQGFGDLLENQ